MKMQRKRANRFPSSKKQTRELSLQVYSGPTRLPSGFGALDTQKIQFGTGNSVASSAGGVVSTVFDAYSQASSSSDWSSISGGWTEFRILSMDVVLSPWNHYNMPTTTNLAPVISVLDRSSSTALSSIGVASNYQSAEIHDPSTRIRRTIKMAGVDEATWTLVGSTPALTARLYVKLYSAGNTASTTLYDYFTITIVEFRGRS